MDDTSPAITKKMHEMIQQKKPIDRLKMGCSMYETSKYLILHAIKKNNPTISTIELRKEFFLRFYGEDFSPKQRDKILMHLERYAPSEWP